MPEAAIGAVGTIAGGLLGMSGAKSAGKEVSRAADAAAQAQLQMFYQSRQDLMPWLKAGRWALGKEAITKADIKKWRGRRNALRQELEDLQGAEPKVSGSWLGPSPEEETQIPDDTARMTELERKIANLTGRIKAGPQEATGLIEMIEKGPGKFVPAKQPGYKYGFEEFIQKPLLQGAAAQGRFFSPGTTNALAQQAQNYASTMYDQFLNRYYKSLTPYQSLAGVGQTAGSMLGQLGMGAAGNIGNALLQGGYGQAGYGIQGTNALLAMLGGLGQLGTNWAQKYYNQSNKSMPPNPGWT